MTWGMHAIGHLELGQEDEASELFNRSYLPYVQVTLIGVLLFFFLQSQPSPRSTCGPRCREVEGRSTSSQGWEGSYRQKSSLGISFSELPQPGSYSWISWREGPTRPFRGITSSLKSSALTDRSPGVAKIASCYLAPHSDRVATARGKDGLDRHHRVLADRG